MAQCRCVPVNSNVWQHSYMATQDTATQIETYRQHFDSMYVGGIPCLLNDNGAFLSFLAVLAGTEALAGLYQPDARTGDRFRAFVSSYFPKALAAHATDLWALRNGMVHSFNPGPFVLTHHQSRLHLQAPQGPTFLNAEDFYAALIAAAHSYFAELAVSPDLQASFVKRLSAKDGGAPQVGVLQQVQ